MSQDHFAEIRAGGAAVLWRKSQRALVELLALPLSVPCVLLMRLLRPFLLVRLKALSSRLGHLVGNTELYLCERDAGINVPGVRHVDIFYFGWPCSNRAMARVIARRLKVIPEWLGRSVFRLNALLPGGAAHRIAEPTQHDRDIFNLLADTPAHFALTPSEDAAGAAALAALGLPPGAPFACPLGRDSRYLTETSPDHDFGYHRYRDSDLDTFVMAAEALAERGVYVVRVGALVEKPLRSAHPRVIDYATSGKRTEFLDVYLGAKCMFCITTSAGFDAIPTAFRRPLVAVNHVPLGYVMSFFKDSIILTKVHRRQADGRELTLREIFDSGVGFALFAEHFAERGVALEGQPPQAIRDAVLELHDRLAGTWSAAPEDEALQARFWSIFPTKAVDAYRGRPLHGRILCRYSAAYLRAHPEWLT